MKHLIYDKVTGRVERVVSCPDEFLALQYDADTQGSVPSDANDDLVYIENGSVVFKLPKPSDNHTFNYATKQWQDPRTLDDIKAAQWIKVKQARSSAEYAGFTWEGSTFDSDALSQNRITGAASLAQIAGSFDAPFTIDWVLADNTVRALDRLEMLQVGVALGAHVATQFAKGVTLRAQIEAATTAAEVEAISW